VPAAPDGAPGVALGAGVDNKREGGKVSVFSGAEGLAGAPAAPAPGAAGLAVGAAVAAEPGVEVAPAPGAPAPCAKALPLNRQTATASPVCCQIRCISPRFPCSTTLFHDLGGQRQSRVRRSERAACLAGDSPHSLPSDRRMSALPKACGPTLPRQIPSRLTWHGRARAESLVEPSTEHGRSQRAAHAAFGFDIRVTPSNRLARAPDPSGSAVGCLF